MTSFTTKFIDGSARLELNLPDEPVNKISRAVRQELESVLDSIASASDIRAVVLISGKRDNFIAGADSASALLHKTALACSFTSWPL